MKMTDAEAIKKYGDAWYTLAPLGSLFESRDKERNKMKNMTSSFFTDLMKSEREVIKPYRETVSLREQCEKIIVDNVNEEYLEFAGFVRALNCIAMKFFMKMKEEGVETRAIRRALELLQKPGYLRDTDREVE